MDPGIALVVGSLVIIDLLEEKGKAPDEFALDVAATENTFAQRRKYAKVTRE